MISRSNPKCGEIKKTRVFLAIWSSVVGGPPLRTKKMFDLNVF